MPWPRPLDSSTATALFEPVMPGESGLGLRRGGGRNPSIPETVSARPKEAALRCPLIKQISMV